MVKLFQRNIIVLVALALSATVLSWARSSRACGAGFSTQSATVSISAQRALISVRNDGTTDVVVQLNVGEGSGDFGVLIPLAAEPTLDATPVDATAFDSLDQATRVRVTTYHGGSGSSSGCGCGDAAKGEALNAGGGDDVQIGSFVDIGPVTAAVLNAENNEALVLWLAENGFEVPVADGEVLAEYVGTGRYFLAFKRKETAAAGAVSVGVHFSVPGDMRGYALRFSQIGAAETVAITVWVVADEGVAPALPFSGVTVDQLSVGSASEYASAVAAKVEALDGHAFVIEGVYSDLSYVLPSSFAEFVSPKKTLTRLSTIVKAEHLDMDVAFTATAPSNVPRQIDAGFFLLPPTGRQVPPGMQRYWLGALLLLLPLIAGVARRRRRLPDLALAR